MGAYEFPTSPAWLPCWACCWLCRGARAGDIAACLLLMLCLGSFSVGIAFGPGF